MAASERLRKEDLVRQVLADIMDVAERTRAHTTARDTSVSRALRVSNSQSCREFCNVKGNLLGTFQRAQWLRGEHYV